MGLSIPPSPVPTNLQGNKYQRPEEENSVRAESLYRQGLET